jgi:membrane fusion protein, multidrug efflux system
VSVRLRSSHLIAAGIAVALAGWLASGQIGADRPAPDAPAVREAATVERVPTVRVRELTAEPVQREIVVNGKTAPARVVTLRAETDGRVDEIGVARGTPVAAGDVLVRLDPRERRAMVQEAEATLARREIEYQAAQKLGAKGFQAETKVAEAKANLEAAQAALTRARVELDHTEIRAPFAGVLDERPIEIGDFVDVGDAVGTVIEQDPFLVTGEVAEREIGRLADGMPGSARLVTGQVVEGQVRYIAAQSDPATRTFTVELEVPNPNGRFAAGVSAELRIGFERMLAHRIPASLLALNDAGVLGVKAIGEGEEVVFYPADVVRAQADAVWLAGLPEQVRVITVGQGFVRAGDQVRAVPEGAVLQDGPLVAEERG